VLHLIGAFLFVLCFIFICFNKHKYQAHNDFALAQWALQMKNESLYSFFLKVCSFFFQIFFILCFFLVAN
jgi:hypothetical protein